MPTSGPSSAPCSAASPPAGAPTVWGGVTLILWSLLLGVAYWVMMHSVPQDPSQLLWSYCLAGFGVGIVGVVPTIAVKSFPAAVRFLGAVVLL